MDLVIYPKLSEKFHVSDLFGEANDNISISSGSSAGFVMNRNAEQLLDNVFSMAGESTDSNWGSLSFSNP